MLILIFSIFFCNVYILHYETVLKNETVFKNQSWVGEKQVDCKEHSNDNKMALSWGFCLGTASRHASPGQDQPVWWPKAGSAGGCHHRPRPPPAP